MKKSELRKHRKNLNLAKSLTQSLLPKVEKKPKSLTESLALPLKTLMKPGKYALRLYNVHGCDIGSIDNENFTKDVILTFSLTDTALLALTRREI